MSEKVINITDKIKAEDNTKVKDENNMPLKKPYTDEGIKKEVPDCLDEGIKKEVPDCLDEGIEKEVHVPTLQEQMADILKGYSDTDIVLYTEAIQILSTEEEPVTGSDELVKVVTCKIDDDKTLVYNDITIAVASELIIRNRVATFFGMDGSKLLSISTKNSYLKIYDDEKSPNNVIIEKVELFEAIQTHDANIFAGYPLYDIDIRESIEYDKNKRLVKVQQSDIYLSVSPVSGRTMILSVRGAVGAELLARTQSILYDLQVLNELFKAVSDQYLYVVIEGNMYKLKGIAAGGFVAETVPLYFWEGTEPNNVLLSYIELARKTFIIVNPEDACVMDDLILKDGKSIAPISAIVPLFQRPESYTDGLIYQIQNIVQNVSYYRNQPATEETAKALISLTESFDNVYTKIVKSKVFKKLGLDEKDSIIYIYRGAAISVSMEQLNDIRNQINTLNPAQADTNTTK